MTFGKVWAVASSETGFAEGAAQGLASCLGRMIELINVRFERISHPSQTPRI